MFRGANESSDYESLAFNERMIKNTIARKEKEIELIDAEFFGALIDIFINKLEGKNNFVLNCVNNDTINF